jgi:Lon protease-like protein
MYDLVPRPRVAEYTPRQWGRFLLDEDAPAMSQHLTNHVLLMLGYSEHYPDDRIAVSATTREAVTLQAVMRDYAERSY